MIKLRCYFAKVFIYLARKSLPKTRDLKSADLDLRKAADKLKDANKSKR